MTDKKLVEKTHKEATEEIIKELQQITIECQKEVEGIRKKHEARIKVRMEELKRIIMEEDEE